MGSSIDTLYLTVLNTVLLTKVGGGGYHVKVCMNRDNVFKCSMIA